MTKQYYKLFTKYVLLFTKFTYSLITIYQNVIIFIILYEIKLTN